MRLFNDAVSSKVVIYRQLHSYRKFRAMIALMMEAVQTSETLVNSYQSSQRYNPEDSHLHTHRRENLKSYEKRVSYY
jgi:hypothetical protein